MEKVKTDSGLTSPETYDKNKMELTITHEGNKGIKKFGYVSCHKSKGNSVSVTMKHIKKMKMTHIGNLLDPKIALSDPCKDSLDTWSKTFCLQTIHTGVKKQMSNNASISFYNSVIDRVKQYSAIN